MYLPPVYKINQVFAIVDKGWTYSYYLTPNCTGPASTPFYIPVDTCISATSSESVQVTCSNSPYNFPADDEYVIQSTYNSTVTNCESDSYMSIVGYSDAFCFNNINSTLYGSYNFECVDGAASFVAYSDSHCQTSSLSTSLDFCYSAIEYGVLEHFQFQCTAIVDYSDAYVYVIVYNEDSCSDQEDISAVEGYGYGECLQSFVGDSIVSMSYTCTGKMPSISPFSLYTLWI
jgi:hypothetical protein